MLCNYGCGQEAKYKLKNNKWCCCKSPNSCIAVRIKNSDNHKKATMCLPKGVKANAANLKCCFPNGMPIMVIQSTIPKTKWERLIQIPPKSIHRIFMIILKQPPA